LIECVLWQQQAMQTGSTHYCAASTDQNPAAADDKGAGEKLCPKKTKQ
jgi:hypothetical protein